jgi:hypothetical protein
LLLLYKSRKGETVVKKLLLRKPYGGLNDVKINVVKNNIRDYENIENSQESALWLENLEQGKNDQYLQSMFSRYPQLSKKLEEQI